MKGTYVGTILVPRILNELKGRCRSIMELDRDLHCTVIYSKDPIDGAEGFTNPSRVYNGFIKAVTWWPGHNGAGYVVAQIFCPLLETRNQFWVGKGGVNTFVDTKLHITLKTGINRTRAESYLPGLQKELLGMRISLTGEHAEALKAI